MPLALFYTLASIALLGIGYFSLRPFITSLMGVPR